MHEFKLNQTDALGVVSALDFLCGCSNELPIENVLRASMIYMRARVRARHAVPVAFCQQLMQLLNLRIDALVLLDTTNCASPDDVVELRLLLRLCIMLDSVE